MMIILMLFISSLFVNPDGWKLEKDKDGIKVYTRLTDGRKIKEFKAVTRINSSLTSVVALVRDSDAAKDWYNHVESGTPIKVFDEKSSIVHLKLNFPFPATDRDLVAKFDYAQDKDTKIVTSSVIGVPDYIPEGNDYIRIKQLEGSWKFTPIEENVIEVQYQFYADPGGGLPVWVINMFIVDDPYKSLKRMQGFVQQDKYQSAVIGFIEE